MIDVRRAESDADLEAWVHVRRVLLPNESAGTVAQQRERESPERLLLLAELNGAVVGSGLGDRSSNRERALVLPRVLPEHRRRGVGTALLRALATHADGQGVRTASSHIDGTDSGAVAFAERFGFDEVDRQVEQVRVLNGFEGTGSPLPAGVEVVTIGERPELLERSYELALQGYADMALPWTVVIPLEAWLRDEATLPEGSLVALAGDEIVGFSGLLDHDSEGIAEDGLTVVRGEWRRRGLAKALKERELAWAAANGLREVVTWTQRGNGAMRKLNERLGYEYRAVTITMVAPLPLRGL
jgi:GNAT superfamily N-acetyltransferase